MQRSANAVEDVHNSNDRGTTEQSEFLCQSSQAFQPVIYCLDSLRDALLVNF